MKTLEQLGFKKKQRVECTIFNNGTQTIFFFPSGKVNVVELNVTQELFDAIKLELKKPKLTEEVKQLIRLLPPELKWLACDNGGSIYAYENKPTKQTYSWVVANSRVCSLRAFEHILSPYISWNDTEPINLDEWGALL